MKKMAIFMVALLIVSATSAKADLVAYWMFDEGSGDTAHDSVGTNDGTLFPLPGGPTWTTGFVGDALYFDGANDIVDLGYTDLFSGWTCMRVEFWAKPQESGETWPCTLAKWTGYSYYEAPAVGVYSPTDVWFWEVTTDAMVNVYTEYPQYADSTVSVDYDEWQHIAYVFDFTSNQVELYKNGTLEQSWSVDIGNCMASGSNTAIGGVSRLGYGHRFKGVIDELRIYDSCFNVSIDIKPGSFPNSINLGSKGVVPIAILSSEYFDATTVDPDTVLLGGASVAVRGKGNKYMAHEEDVNGDGLPDLVCQVETENLDPESFQNGNAILTAKTYSSVALKGVDTIIIVPPE